MPVLRARSACQSWLAMTGMQGGLSAIWGRGHALISRLDMSLMDSVQACTQSCTHACMYSCRHSLMLVLMLSLNYFRPVHTKGRLASSRSDLPDVAGCAANCGAECGEAEPCTDMAAASCVRSYTAQWEAVHNCLALLSELTCILWHLTSRRAAQHSVAVQGELQVAASVHCERLVTQHVTAWDAGDLMPWNLNVMVPVSGACCACMGSTWLHWY